MDQRVLQTQQWLNQTYTNPNFVTLDEDGITGRRNCQRFNKRLANRIRRINY